MLIPQFRKYKKINRKTLRSTYELKSCQLKFASMGLQAIEKGLLTGKQIEAVRRTITGRLKRRAKVWIRCYPDYPITRKPREVRMGRGKGAVDSWVCVVKPGRVLFEVFNTEMSRVGEVLSFAMLKLPLFSRVIARNSILNG